MTRNFTFSGRFWEHSNNNGVVTLVSRMRMGKLTCERLKAAFELRVASEQQYADNLLRMATQLEACEETGQLAYVLKTTRDEWTSLATTRLQNAQNLNAKVVQPLSTLLSKQKQLRRELQASMTKLYNNRQLQTHCVLRARDRYNAECTKANETMQQSSGKEKHQSYKRASAVIKKYQQAYDDAMADLEMVTEEWNKQWQYTCQKFEELEEERLGFVRSNIYHGNDLCLATATASVEAYEKIEAAVDRMDVDADLDDFVQTMGGSDSIPGTMDYIKLFVLQEHNKREEVDIKETSEPIKIDGNNPDESRSLEDQEITADDNVSSLMVGRIEIYNSDDDTDYANSDDDYDEMDNAETDQPPELTQNEDLTEYSETADGYPHYDDASLQKDDDLATDLDIRETSDGDLDYTRETLDDDVHSVDGIQASSQYDYSESDRDDARTSELGFPDGEPISKTDTDNYHDIITEDNKKVPYFDQTHPPSNHSHQPSSNRSNQPPPPPPLHHYDPEPPSGYKVNEELESMLQQLEEQTIRQQAPQPSRQPMKSSKPFAGRARLSGVRQRTPKPGQKLLKELAGIQPDASTPSSTIFAGSDAPVDFFDPFSSLASMTQTEDQQKWRLHEVTHALKHSSRPARRPLPERPD